MNDSSEVSIIEYNNILSFIIQNEAEFIDIKLIDNNKIQKIQGFNVCGDCIVINGVHSSGYRHRVAFESNTDIFNGRIFGRSLGMIGENKNGKYIFYSPESSIECYPPPIFSKGL